MRFTDFGSVVKTYKKNFQLRKKTFVAERKATQAKKKKDREDRIEAVKAVQPLIKIKGSTSKKINFLGDIKKFLGFMLAGFILQNLKTILPILQNIIKKIGDIVKGVKEFVEGVIGGVQNFFEGLDGAKKRMEDLLSPILNADLSNFVPFQNQLDKVLTGVLAIAGIITGLYQGSKGADGSGDGSTLIDETAKGSAVGVNIAAQRKAARLKALNEAKKLKAQRAAERAAAREAAARKLRAESNLTRIAREKAAQRAAEKAARIAVAQESLRKAILRENIAITGGSTGTTKPLSPGAGIPSGAKITPDIAKLFKQNIAKMGGSPINLGDMGDFVEPTTDVKSLVNEAIEESARRKAIESAAKDAAFFNKAGIDPGKLFTEAQLDQFGEDLLKDKKFKSITPLEKLVGKPSATPYPASPSPDKVSKFNQIMKNARGFIKPKNLKLLRGFAKDLGIGLAIEFAAGWAIDRGLEALKLDEKSLLEERVLKFNRLPKEKQKSIIETYNKNLEKELEYQKTFFAKVEKVIALGDMTVNERRIKSLTSFLTAVSISGAGPVYDLVSAGPLPDYLGSDVDIELPTQAPAQPSTPKISTPSVMPPLPPTGTLGTGAQAYGAPRAGGTRRHAGVDFDPADDKNSKFYSRIGGRVMRVLFDPNGYGNYVDIYNAELDKTERIAEGNRNHVKVGDIVKPGTLVQSGSEMTGVFHYEIRDGKVETYGFKGTLDPIKFLKNLQKTQDVKQSPQAFIKTSSSNLISSAGLDQPTTYSSEGMSVRREVNNIFVPIAA